MNNEQTKQPADAVYDSDGKRLRWRCGCRQNGGVQVQAYRPPRFPLAEVKLERMVISLSGVLERAADQCKRSRDNKHLVWPLKKLQEHINHLRESDSDEQAIERLEEFLRLWVES
jgi:hypothetical protein